MELEKFDKWNSEKKKIHKNKYEDFYVNIREIWFTKMGINIGYEENGKNKFLRPVLVLKKVGNLFFTIALTSQGKDNNPFYFKFNDIYLKNPKYKNSSYAILSQVKVMDKKRFFEHSGSVSKQDFANIKEKLKEFLL